MSPDLFLFISILAAGFYMAWNIGANDVANAMGTSVGSGALTLRKAVLVAAVLEFSGAFFFGSHVSETIQKGIFDVSFFNNEPMTLVYGMLAVLISAGAWLQIASYYGWPVSTTHTIIGAVVGFGVVCAGVDAVYWGNVFFIVFSWVLSPICGAVTSYLIFTLLRNRIFYASSPFKATKKITPFLVFLIMTVLSLVLVFNIKSVHLNVNLWQGWLISMVPGLLGAIISWYLIKDMTIFTSAHTQKSKSNTIHEIEEAQHHLLLASAGFPEAVQGRLSEMVEEINHLKPTITKESDLISNEYTAVEKIFAYLQIMSACLMAFAHGANDVANAIGPLAAAITTLQTGAIVSDAPIPTWILTLGGVGIVIGLATWGWRVIETIGKKITELTPTRGFAAEFGAATTIVLASQFGMPISTTHTLVGSVLGVGLARGMEALNLSMTRDIFISWIVTVPAGAGATVIFFYILKALFL